MKTLNVIPALFLALIFVCLSGAPSFASEPVANAADNLQKMIKSSIKYPENALKNACAGTVDMVFTVNEDGQLNIEEIWSDNKELSDCLKKQLATICCKGIKTLPNQHYALTVTFKLV